MAESEDLVQTLRFDKLAATGEFETRREATKPRRGHNTPKGVVINPSPGVLRISRAFFQNTILSLAN